MSPRDAINENVPASSSPADNETTTVSRRRLLASTGAIGAALAGGLAYAADGPGHQHADHAPRQAGVLDAADQCSHAARRCLSHCLVSFEEGDTTLASCAKSVHDTISICDALAAQAASNSKYVGGIAKVCRAACDDCEKECRKHENEHVECRQCADACARLISEIDKMMA